MGSFADAHKFEAYLAEHLGYHKHDPSVSGVINKRDDDDDDDDDDFGKNLDALSSHIPSQDKRVWDSLIASARTNTVTKWIDDHGYGVVFGLMEHLNHMNS